MKETILSEIIKIPNLKEGEKIKSFIIFNINKEEKTNLYKTISNEFIEINNQLDELRKNEVSNLYDLKKTNFKKLENLEERYINSDRIDYVKEQNSEIRKDLISMIEKSDTLGSYLKKSYNFKELILDEYLDKEIRYDFLNENLDFSNLINVNNKNPNFKYYKLTSEEKEYENLKDYFNEYHSLNSLVTYSEKFEPKFDKLLNSVFSVQYLNWFIISFKISKEEFDKKINERNKYWLYRESTIIIK